MGRQPDDGSIPAHVAAVSARAQAETDRLTSQLLRRCWPGGTRDHSELVALEWLRRWRPRAVPVASIGCGCATGRCETCN